MPTAVQTAQLITAVRSGDHRGANQMLEALVAEQRERGFQRGAEELERLRLSLQRRTPQEEASRTPRPQRHPMGSGENPLASMFGSHPDEGEEGEANLDEIPEGLEGLLVKDENQKNLSDIYLYEPVRKAIDQFLLEYCNYTNNPWIHISLNPNLVNRNQTLTFWNHRKHSEGLSNLA